MDLRSIVYATSLHCKMYLSRFITLFVQIAKIYLSTFLNLFVQISKRICTNCKSHFRQPIVESDGPAIFRICYLTLQIPITANSIVWWTCIFPYCKMNYFCSIFTTDSCTIFVLVVKLFRYYRKELNTYL